MSIRIEKNGTTITTDDVSQAAALVNLLAGMPAPAAETSSEPRTRKPRKAKGEANGKAAADSGLVGHGAKVAAFLAKRESADLGAIAKATYGEDTPAARVRSNSVLRGLIKVGHAKRVGRGEYATT